MRKTKKPALSGIPRAPAVAKIVPSKAIVATGDEENEAVLNPMFKFDMDSSDASIVGASSWDFAKAKKMLQDSSFKGSLTSVDEKIAAVKALKFAKVSPKTNVNHKEDSESDEDSLSEAEPLSDTEPSFQGESSSEEDASSETDADDIVSDEDSEDREDVIRDKVLVEKKHQDKYFGDMPDIAVHSTFVDYKLSRAVLRALNILGYSQPTPIQAQAIPIALLGRDICGSAITGSGKTAAFMIPIIERLLHRPRNAAQIRVLILTPTRELALQCQSVATKISQCTDIQIGLAIGGMNMKIQESELRQRPDVLIATPGRLIDHLLNSHSFNLDNLEILVMDEADRMLEVGFSEELKEIIRHCPVKRQTMLFSATMTEDIDQLISMSLNKPVRLFVDRSTDIPENLVQEFIRIREKTENNREAILLALCTRTFHERCIIFCRSKVIAHRLRVLFGLCGLKAAELHGDLSQQQRLESLEIFRDRQVNYLIATDLASRGIDIVGIETVINFHLPKVTSGYIHRIGRTARAGRSGRSVSLVGEEERKVLKEILKSSKGQVKNRILQPEVIAKYKKRIDGLNEQLKEVIRQEKEEKEASLAYQEATKAENLIQYADEIKSRPAKVWFKMEENDSTGQNKKRKFDGTHQSEDSDKSGNVFKKSKIETNKREKQNGDKKMDKGGKIKGHGKNSVTGKNKKGKDSDGRKPTKSNSTHKGGKDNKNGPSSPNGKGFQKKNSKGKMGGNQRKDKR